MKLILLILLLPTLFSCGNEASVATLQAGDTAHQDFSVEALGVTLLPGEYRLVKTFLSQGESFHEISIAAPFWVK